jgi:hypothetical protein
LGIIPAQSYGALLPAEMMSQGRHHVNTKGFIPFAGYFAETEIISVQAASSLYRSRRVNKTSTLLLPLIGHFISVRTDFMPPSPLNSAKLLRPDRDLSIVLPPFG